jgi:uncharacterized protein (TIGR02186 family)
MKFRFLSLIILIALIFFASSADAELTIDVSEPTLEISTGFTGDTLTLFGTSNQKGDIVIIVEGPEDNTIIRRKTNVMGLWINAQSVEFIDVPGYYNVASSRPIADIADIDIRQKYRMGINSLIFTTVDDDITPTNKNRFLEALIQNKQLAGLYSLTPDAVDYLNDTLFKTTIYMPSNVPIGNYDIKAFLFKDGQLIDQTDHPFKIEQVGLTASVHEFAFDSPFLYGLTVIFIALFSSFLAILLLRRE